MHFKNVVASVESLEAREFQEALRLTEPGGSLHILYALPKRSPPARLQEAFDTLRERVRLDARSAASRVSIHSRLGDRVEETLRLAVESDADLIVAGAFQPDSSRVVAPLIARAACSVLVLAPNRERAETEGFVPDLSLCPACSDERSRHNGQWYCGLHRNPAEKLFETLADPR